MVVMMFNIFLIKRVPRRGLEQRESGKIVLYLLISIIIIISYIIIKLLIKMRTIAAKTANHFSLMSTYRHVKQESLSRKVLLKRKALSTVDLLAFTSLDQLIFIMKIENTS